MDRVTHLEHLEAEFRSLRELSVQMAVTPSALRDTPLVLGLITRKHWYKKRATLFLLLMHPGVEPAETPQQTCTLLVQATSIA